MNLWTDTERAVRRHYTLVCCCEWNGDDEWPTRVESNRDCVMHCDMPDPLGSDGQPFWN